MSSETRSLMSESEFKKINYFEKLTQYDNMSDTDKIYEAINSLYYRNVLGLTASDSLEMHYSTEQTGENTYMAAVFSKNPEFENEYGYIINFVIPTCLNGVAGVIKYGRNVAILPSYATPVQIKQYKCVYDDVHTF